MLGHFSFVPLDRTHWSLGSLKSRGKLPIASRNENLFHDLSGVGESGSLDRLYLAGRV